MSIASSLDPSKVLELENTAVSIRSDVLQMIQHAGSGNPGSALSCIEILTWLMRHEMNIRSDQPRWEERDRLILSKGHAAPVFYALSVLLGWIKKEELMGFRCFETRLQTHPEFNAIAGIDFASGSLGQGLSVAAGMAIAARYLKNKISRFFVLLGDGELQEGQVWEAAMTCGHYGLDKVIVIVDRNYLQGDNFVEISKNIEPLVEKFLAFNWEVKEVDGHSFCELEESLKSMKSQCPKLVVANTIKGKGVSFMENNNQWHVGGKKFTKNLLQQALSEIGR